MSTTAPLQQAKAEASRADSHRLRHVAQLVPDDTGFIDARPQATAQKHLQEIANNGHQARQLQAFHEMARTSVRAMQLKAAHTMMNTPASQDAASTPKSNRTGLPDNLKVGVEALSGVSMDDVKVHYNSPRPAQLHAHAFAQGSDIHVGPGQQKHLPHEAWHVVQQRQGRVRATGQLGGAQINDDGRLEREADVMGSRAVQMKAGYTGTKPGRHDSLFQSGPSQGETLQRIAWHDKAHGTAALNNVPAMNGVNDNGYTTSINVAGYMFTGPMYTLDETTGADNKVALISSIAGSIGGIAHPSNQYFLTKSQLETTLAINQTVPQAGINARFAANARNTYRGALDPYIVRAPGKTKDNESMALHYQFGRDSYGYIVKIEQEGKLYTMHAGRGQEELVKDQTKALGKGIDDELFEQFSSAHDTDSPDEIISEVASKNTLDKDLTLYPSRKAKGRKSQVGKLAEKSKRLDAVAKIGGEGARWQCVREHAVAGKLANSSRFYTVNYHNKPAGLIGMTFQTLWGAWASDFGSAFNIDNDTVVERLLDLYDSDSDKIVLMNEEDITNADYSLN